MQWLVFSQLDLTAAEALDRELQNALDAFLDEHPDAQTAWTCLCSTRIPPGVKAPRGTRSLFVIDEPAPDPADDPVAVAMLKALIERGKPLLVDWGEADFGGGTAQAPDAARALLAKLPAEERLFGAAPAAAAPARGGGTASLSERVLEIFAAALEDVEKGIELKDALAEASEPARRWLEHVVRTNAAEDAAVDAAVGLPPERSPRIHREVEALLEEFTGARP